MSNKCRACDGTGTRDGYDIAGRRCVIKCGCIFLNEEFPPNEPARTEDDGFDDLFFDTGQ
jgi:hypothetical protein